MHDEYLRRNLLVAGAIGARANIDAALGRLRKRKGSPKWLMDLLEGARERVVPLPADLATWRDLAPDAPDYARPRQAAATAGGGE